MSQRFWYSTTTDHSQAIRINYPLLTGMESRYHYQMTAEQFSQQTRPILKDVFGFDDFRPGQEDVVNTLLSGRSALAVMPTGSGKSLCYQVPALVLGGLTIVVSPLVALMQDQVAALKLAGVAADTINSSRSREENVETWHRAARGEITLLYLAPERLMTEHMLAALSRLPVRLIAVDEAHCISQWGPAFRPEYEDLSKLRDFFTGVPLVALTATADAVTRQDIEQKVFAGDGSTFVSGFDRPNIRLAVEMKRDWKSQLLRFLESHGGESGIIYCLSRKKTEETARLLQDNDVRALPYHAGMNKTDRVANHNTFLTEPSIVIVATIAFGMGIDKPDVRFVFHTDIPGSVEAYYQEIGRAGRDGQPAVAHMLYGLDDLRMRRMFIDQEDSADDRKRREHKRLDALISYCESPECRRRALLGYFDEQSGECKNCDMCLDPVPMADGTRDGQLALEAVRETGERFGAVHIIDILRGGQTEKILSSGHDRLSVHGSGSHHSKDVWRSIIRQLVAADFLKLDIQGYGGLSITTKGKQLCDGNATFQFRVDTIKTGKAKKSTASKPAPEIASEDNDLLLHLKQFRLKLAQERGVPAYVIFSDRTLIDMATRRPQTRAEFAEIHGVGETKLREFAEMFLELLQSDSHQDTTERLRA